MTNYPEGNDPLVSGSGGVAGTGDAYSGQPGTADVHSAVPPTTQYETGASYSQQPLQQSPQQSQEQSQQSWSEPPRQGVYAGSQGGVGGKSGGSLGSRMPNVNVRSTFLTSEFWVLVLGTLGILIASAVADGPDGGGGLGFGAQEAWKFITWLAIGYMISRGLTKLRSNDEGR